MADHFEILKIPNLSSNINPHCVNAAITHSILALPYSHTIVAVWNLSIPEMEPLMLSGHQTAIMSLCFSQSHQILLCSASDSELIIWNLKNCFSHSSENMESNRFVLNHKPGDVNDVCFSTDSAYLSMCVDTAVQVVSVAQGHVMGTLVGHSARVTQSMFCAFYSATLVSISDDRTIIVWDVCEMTLIYRSPLLTPNPLISMCMLPLVCHVLVASSCGIIRIFDLSERHSFREIGAVDVKAILLHERQSDIGGTSSVPESSDVQAKSAYTNNCREHRLSVTERPTIVEPSYCVLNLKCFVSRLPHCIDGRIPPASCRKDGAIEALLTAPRSILVVVTSHCLLQIDTRTLNVVSSIDMKHVSNHDDLSLQNTGGLRYGAVSLWTDQSCLVVAGTQFKNNILCLRWTLYNRHEYRLNSDKPPCVDVIQYGLDELEITTQEHCINVVASCSLYDNSPLKFCCMLNDAMNKKVPKVKNMSVRERRKSVTNQSVFHQSRNETCLKHKIKSSGYLQRPRTTLFTPKTNTSMNPTVSDKRSTKGRSFTSIITCEEYRDTIRPPNTVDREIFLGPTRITDLRYTKTGNHLACGLSDNSLIILQSSFKEDNLSVLTGHQAAVSSLRWSNDGRLLISSAGDKTAKIWERSNGKLLLTLNYMQLSHKGNLDNTLRRADCIKNEVRGAQFYFVDKFVLLVYGNRLMLYNYHIDEDAKACGFNSRNRYKLVHSWETTAQHFTCLTAANSFHSHLAVCPASNRSIALYDLNAARLCHSFDDAHTKPAHCVALNEGSVFHSQPQCALNVFATSAKLDCIRLWDVRSRACVLRLQGHKNQTHGCGISFSACGTYLASGSEDRSAYLYDVRMATYCDRLKGQYDVVTSVAFHPTQGQLVAGSADGRLVLFKRK